MTNNIQCSVCKQTITEQVAYIITESGPVHDGPCLSFLHSNEKLYEDKDEKFKLNEVNLLL